MKVVNSGRDSVELNSVNRTKKNTAADKVDSKKENRESSEVSAFSSLGKVEISEDARIMAKGMDAVKSADISDQEKIAMIKEKIKNQQYQPDFGEVADKLMEEHILTS